MVSMIFTRLFPFWAKLRCLDNLDWRYHVKSSFDNYFHVSFRKPRIFLMQLILDIRHYYPSVTAYSSGQFYVHGLKYMLLQLVWHAQLSESFELPVRKIGIIWTEALSYLQVGAHWPSHFQPSDTFYPIRRVDNITY